MVNASLQATIFQSCSLNEKAVTRTEEHEKAAARVRCWTYHAAPALSVPLLLLRVWGHSQCQQWGRQASLRAQTWAPQT